MDNKNGEFEFLGQQDLEALGAVEQSNTFKVGEVLEIKDSRFRVQKIGSNKMMLKLLKPN